MQAQQPQTQQTQQICYYQVLNLNKTCTQDEIKQSYKKLALKYHPDKNQDKEMAKKKFHQLSQAYTILNDPKKRQKYDKYGVRESEQNDLDQFEDFMGDFGTFEQFIDEVLCFDQMDKLFEEMMKTGGFGGKLAGGKKKKKGGRTKKRSGGGGGLGGIAAMMGGGAFDFGDMNGAIEEALAETMLQQLGGFGGDMSQQQLNELLKDPDFADVMKQQGFTIEELLSAVNPSGSTKPLKNKNSKKFGMQNIFNPSAKKEQNIQDSQDQQQLSAEQKQLLEFGNMHLDKKKKKGKKILHCKFDGVRVKQDYVLIHFGQMHKQQFEKWKANGKVRLVIQKATVQGEGECEGKQVEQGSGCNNNKEKEKEKEEK